MQLKIKQWGNSAGLPLSKPLLEQIAAGVGDSVSVEVRNGALVIKPVRQTPDLKSLLGGSPVERLQKTEEDETWVGESPAGRELL